MAKGVTGGKVAEKALEAASITANKKHGLTPTRRLPLPGIRHTGANDARYGRSRRNARSQKLIAAVLRTGIETCRHASNRCRTRGALRAFTPSAHQT